MPRRRGIKGEVTQGKRPERYVHLAADGQAYFYESPDRYVPIPAWESFAAVFRVDRLYERQSEERACT